MDEKEKSKLYRGRMAMGLAAFATLSCIGGVFFYVEGPRPDALEAVLILGAACIAGLILWLVLKGVFWIADLIASWWDKFDENRNLDR
jgi:hypothetical protein